ncbi:helix-turn-helix domain-containing protein [Sphingomonas sp. LaA6.9]|uniref:helix-turn-helix domain-containing protein n=1 Tax=Sphingomonas sp. LaA6.9 TaxID=2919914 RepID=UPI001F4FA112|nr:helix-turn-helix transcriptional regulator [Sphingomonas sp. LaA6.9]MCJ8158835.1 helix-turn-helix transcriptional regulator [Sphingomonas sp. LaA6.9]
MKLLEWRRSKGLTQQLVADGIDCVLSTVARYEKGLRTPDDATMVRIYVFTEGEVQPNDFYELPDLRAQRKAA